MRSEAEVNNAVERYADMIKHICFCHLKKYEDCEDIFQNVFLKYMLYDGRFESDEHEKAWFIRVTINASKDHLRGIFKRKTVPIDEIIEQAQLEDEDYSHVLEAVLALPEKYKDVIYLFYYEEYKVAEIARILNKKENTIYSLLSRGREQLKLKLGGEFYV